MRVWLDDVRPMPSDFTHWAKTADEAIALLKTGLVEEISLDHDLGLEKTGYTVALFIEESAYNGSLLPLKIKIHSQNPVGKEKMKQAIRNAFKFWAS